MGRIRILVADDHASVRAGTRRLLEREEDLEVVAEASDGDGAVSLAASLLPDVAVLDIMMPGIDGIEAARQIKRHSPTTAVLMLTVLEDDGFIAKAIEVGASGYVMKSARNDDLVQAVRALGSRVPKAGAANASRRGSGVVQGGQA